MKLYNKLSNNSSVLYLSEWLLFNAKMSKYSAISWRGHVTFDEVIVISALY
jgi:hypothetical protein